MKKLKKHAISIGVGICTSEEIDQLNIYEATKVAMGACGGSFRS